MRMIWYILGAVGLLACIFGGMFADFAVRSRPTDDRRALPPALVVFTGQFDRIERGLELLAAGQARSLFISGVNPKAGLKVERFADQFALTAEQENWLTTGRLTLAPHANTTLENALEAACWLELLSDTQSVTLITSQRHMARASLALERATKPVHVIRVASDPPETHLAPWNNLIEARKFAITWGLTLLPRHFWPVNTPENCVPN